MDGDKKEYLESLRRQIDPEVISRMTDCMTRDTPSSGLPTADRIREQRVLAKRCIESDKPVIVALGIHEVQTWFAHLVHIQNEVGSDKQKAILDGLVAFLVVESRKQVTDFLGKIFGIDRIISLTDDPLINREKIQKIMAPAVSGQNEGRG